jgi:hypothetical protein
VGGVIALVVQGLGGLVLIAGGILVLRFPRNCQRLMVSLLKPEKSRIDAFFNWWYAGDLGFWLFIVWGILMSIFGFALIFEAVTLALHHAV